MIGYIKENRIIIGNRIMKKYLLFIIFILILFFIFSTPYIYAGAEHINYQYATIVNDSVNLEKI